MPDIMSPLARIIAAEIAQTGTITLERYISLCLGHPDHGVYTSRDPIGAEGDFTTSPEISQMFGELIGLWTASVWQSMAKAVNIAPHIHLIELGPGRGTLMADALRAASTLPGFIDHLTVHLVETGRTMRTRQAASLSALNIEPSWHDDLTTVPPGASIIIANEFFDALPIQQYVRQSHAWHERLVGLDDTGALVFKTTQTPATMRLLDSLFPYAGEGEIAEICPAAHEVIATIGARFRANPGAGLIIDYGHSTSGTGDTLQAVAKHQYADPLARPGEADITAHVDFAALRQRARKASLTTYGPIGQGRFLNQLGLGKRAKMLCQNASSAQVQDIARAAKRLTAQNQMGTLFKVMALTSAKLAPPAPFTTTDQP
jgi:NADH dehydrogenase [ubiquinone] 1 alpha subcomplex assembly factor 7